MKSIKQTYHIQAPRQRIWLALTDTTRIAEWGGGPAVMDARENTVFSLWGGSIHGRNTKVVPYSLLEQDWFSGDTWQQASNVSFALDDTPTGTSLTLVHTNIPDEEADEIDEGWREYYLGPLQKLVESQSTI